MRNFLAVVIFSTIISVFAEDGICHTTTFSVDNSNHKYIPVNDHGWHVITVNSSVPMENISSLKPPKVTSKAYQVDVEDMNCEKPNISKKTCRFKVRVSYPAGPPSQTNDFFKGGEVTFKTNHGICNYELAMHPYSSQLFSNFRTIFPGEQPYYPDGNGVAELGTTLLANQSQYVVFMLQNTSAFMNKNNVIIKEIKLSDNNNAGRVNWNLMERSDKDVDQIYGKLEQCGTEGDSKKGKPISYSLSNLDKDKNNSCFLIYRVESLADAVTKIETLTVDTNAGSKTLHITTNYTAKTQLYPQTLYFSANNSIYSCGFSTFEELGHSCLNAKLLYHFKHDIGDIWSASSAEDGGYLYLVTKSTRNGLVKCKDNVCSILENIQFGADGEDRIISVDKVNNKLQINGTKNLLKLFSYAIDSSSGGLTKLNDTNFLYLFPNSSDELLLEENSIMELYRDPNSSVVPSVYLIDDSEFIPLFGGGKVIRGGLRWYSRAVLPITSSPFIQFLRVINHPDHYSTIVNPDITKHMRKDNLLRQYLYGGSSQAFILTYDGGSNINDGNVKVVAKAVEGPYASKNGYELANRPHYSIMGKFVKFDAETVGSNVYNLIYLGDNYIRSGKLELATATDGHSKLYENKDNAPQDYANLMYKFDGFTGLSGYRYNTPEVQSQGDIGFFTIRKELNDQSYYTYKDFSVSVPNK